MTRRRRRLQKVEVSVPTRVVEPRTRLFKLGGSHSSLVPSQDPSRSPWYHKPRAEEASKVSRKFGKSLCDANEWTHKGVDLGLLIKGSAPSLSAQNVLGDCTSCTSCDGGTGLSPPLLLGAVSAFKKVELILLVICKSAWVTSRWPAGPFVAFPASCFIECQSNWLENIRIGGKEHPKCKIAIQSWYSLYSQYIWNFTYRVCPISQWKYNTTMCIKCK